MITYFVKDQKNTTTLNALAILQGGALPKDRKRALVSFDMGRKGITNVPMGWALSESIGAVGNGILTSSLAGCQALILIGGAIDNKVFKPETISFTHIQGGTTDNVNWDHMLKAFKGAAVKYAIIESNRAEGTVDHIAEYLIEKKYVPTANIFVYNQGVGEQGGRTFAINSNLDIGQYDEKVVTREKQTEAQKLTNKGAIAQNPGIQAGKVEAVKKPR